VARACPPILLLLAIAAQLSAAASQSGVAQPVPTLASILQRPVSLRDGIGRSNDRVTTSSAQAQAFYNQGLAYLHSYVWIDAARSFNQALGHDPKIAMAYVGLSEALGELGLPSEAREASARAQELAGAATERERLRVRLRASQLDASAHPDDEPLRTAYRRQLDELLTKYPDDVEFLLLVGRAQDPSTDGHGMGVGSASLRFYERALARSPDYFAVHHYMTHAYENIDRIDRALVHAERYAAAAPAVPHAHHMYAHVLRRADRVEDAIAEFETADRLERASLQAEEIPLEYDWHYRHNLNLLGMTLQYAGRVISAEPALRRSFELKSLDRSTQELNRKEWPTLLLARGRADEALAAARTLATDSVPLAAAMGHLLACRALQSLNRLDAAAEEGDLALGQMRAIGPLGGSLVPEFQLTQGEFLLRRGEADKARAMLRDAAAKLRAQSGPDAWVQMLFSLEQVTRVARELGDWPLAAEFARLMQSHDRGYAGTQYALGRASEHDGDRAAARRFYAGALRGWARADPSLPELLDTRRRLAALPAAKQPARR
jgi:tetratricopeptide (TPR) repeat protein